MMYTSGQFAMMGNVGRKALRIYREEGLLIPVMTNEENGYHYYDESQLSTLETIRRLRSIGLSLFEIKQILNGEANEEDIVKSKIKETDSLLKDMKEMLSDKSQTSSDVQAAEPDIRSFERCTCLYIDENVEPEKLGMSVGKLYEKAAKAGSNLQEVILFSTTGLDDEEKFTMRTCLPVADHFGDDMVEIYESGCLHLNFRGGFSKVSDAHKVIHKYAEEHNIVLSDRAYEVYNKDMSVDVYHSLT